MACSFGAFREGPAEMSIQVEVTSEAQTQVRELIRSQKPGTGVRVFLEAGGGGCGCGSGGGGCGCGAGEGGPRFGMAFDRQRSDDQVIPVDGFSLYVDHDSSELLDGATIDFLQSLDATGFKITAPKLAPVTPGPAEGTSGGCGCGSGGCGCG